MKKFLVIIIVSIISVNISYSQVIGLLGKKLTLNYNLQFFGSLFNPNINGVNSFKSFNSANIFGADYILLKNMSVGISHSRFNTRVNYDEEFTYLATLVDYYGSEWEDNFDFTADTSSIIHAKSLGIYAKIYHTSEMAPIGLYSKIGFSKMNYSIDYDPIAILHSTPAHYDGSYLKNAPFPVPIDNYSTFSISYGLYYSTILFERVILNWGFNTEYGLNSLVDWFIVWNEYDGVNPDNYLKYITDKRLFNHRVLNFDFGIGVLIF